MDSIKYIKRIVDEAVAKDEAWTKDKSIDWIEHDELSYELETKISDEIQKHLTEYIIPEKARCQNCKYRIALPFGRYHRCRKLRPFNYFLGIIEKTGKCIDWKSRYRRSYIQEDGK